MVGARLDQLGMRCLRIRQPLEAENSGVFTRDKPGTVLEVTGEETWDAGFGRREPDKRRGAASAVRMPMSGIGALGFKCDWKRGQLDRIKVTSAVQFYGLLLQMRNRRCRLAEKWAPAEKQQSKAQRLNLGRSATGDSIVKAPGGVQCALISSPTGAHASPNRSGVNISAGRMNG